MSTTSDNLHSEPLQSVVECGSHNLTDIAAATVASPTPPAGAQGAAAPMSGTSIANQAVVTAPSKQSAGGSATAPVETKKSVNGSQQEPPAMPEPPSTCFDPWQVYTFEDALKDEDEPWDWTIEGLLLSKAGLLCSGQPHAVKSLSWLAAAMGSVIEKMVWGQFPTPNVKRVLFIETEDPKQVVKKRIRELAKGFGIKAGRMPEGFMWMRTGRFDLTDKKVSQPRLRKLLEKHNPDWCVLSTLQGLIPNLDWKEQKDMDPVMAFIVGLCDDYCPIVLITHSPQDKSAKRAAGTITQAANFLTVVHFEKKTEKGETKVKVTVDSKIGVGENFSLRLETESKEVRSVVHGDQEPKLKERILEFLSDINNLGASTPEIMEATGCSAEYARKVRKELESKAPVKGKTKTQKPAPFSDVAVKGMEKERNEKAIAASKRQKEILSSASTFLQKRKANDEFTREQFCAEAGITLAESESLLRGQGADNRWCALRGVSIEILAPSNISKPDDRFRLMETPGSKANTVKAAAD